MISLIKSKDLLKEIFDDLSYSKIMNFKYNKFFIENNYKELYDSKLKIIELNLKQYIEKIQDKLKINEKIILTQK